MNETNAEAIQEKRSFISRHSFLIFISSSILISCVIVVISMQMYNSSGAAQLDLSRPGYVSVRSQVDNSDGDFQAYSSSGAISEKVINDFKTLFNQQAKKVETVNAFGDSPSPLDPVALGINDTSQQ
jgi:hypothetical protein